jgi:hypothetical protein
MLKWIINKGCHFSLSNFWQRFIPKIGTSPVNYKFNIPKETYFPYVDPNDLDINKLAGFSFLNHHTNSVRIGWVPNFKKENTISLYIYIYNKSIRYSYPFADIDCDKDYRVEISFNASQHYVSFEIFDENDVHIKKQSAEFAIPKFRIGYFLWFYFGGNKTAPKEMVAWLSKR